MLAAESHFFRRIMEEVFGNEQQFIWENNLKQQTDSELTFAGIISPGFGSGRRKGAGPFFSVDVKDASKVCDSMCII